MVSINKKNSRQPRQSRERNRPEWEPPYQPDTPLPGLEPVGGGFYATSGEPVSPYDCDRWPDSPFCGGFPFTEQPVGFNFSFVLDECNIGIQAAPVFGFVKLPLTQFVYRFPGECRLLPPPPTPSKDLTNYNTKKIIPPGFYFTYKSYSYVYEDGRGGSHGRLPIGFYEVSSQVSVVRTQFLDETKQEPLPFLTGNDRPDFLIELRIDRSLRTNVAYAIEYSSFQGMNDHVVARGGSPLDSADDLYAEWNVNWGGTVKVYIDLGRFIGLNDDQSGTLGGAIELHFGLSYGDGTDFITNYKNSRRLDFSFYSRNRDGFPIEIPSSYEPRQISIDETIEDWFGLLYRGYGYVIDIEQEEMGWQRVEQKEPLPPPPDKRDCECMCCDDTLLRLIYKRLNDLHKTVGSEDYPVSVPQWITKENSPKISIANLTRFVSYTIKQLDAISGNYPIKIKIQDSDLTQEGDQTKTVTIPNAAEGIAEMVGLLLAIRTEVSATLAAAVNSMVEAGSSKQTAFLAYEYAKANAEYLAYKGKQVERELPFSFKPNEPQLDKMLQPTKVKVKGWDNDDKQDITDALAPLLEMAAMYKAQNFRKLGANSPVDRLREILKGAADIPASMGEFRKYPPQPTQPEGENDTEPEVQKDEWDVFIDQAEQGFIAQPGITDNLHPYGRPTEQRPRIREIGNDTSDTNNTGNGTQ